MSLYIISHIFVITKAIDNIDSFGIMLHSNANSGTTSTVTVTLWYNFTIFQCNMYPTTYSTAYFCESSSWTILDSSGCPKTDIQQYKIMINNPAPTDALIIDYVFLWETNTIWYSTSAWCVLTSSAPPGLNNIPSWKINDLNCGSGYTHYNTLCINNNMNDCGPPQQMLYFDMNSPNLYETLSQWNAYTNYIIDAITCNPTSDPTTNPTNYPTINPTYIPTQIPTQNPTINPTYLPTLIPTRLPTYDTNNPSLIPTVSPTFIPSIAPNPTINVIVNYPTYMPTEYTNDTLFIMSMEQTDNNNGNNKLETLTIIGSLNMIESILVIALLAMLVIIVCLVLILWKIKQYNMKNNKRIVKQTSTVTHETDTNTIVETEMYSMEKIKSLSDGQIGHEDNIINGEGEANYENSVDHDDLYKNSNVTTAGNEVNETNESSESGESLFNNNTNTVTMKQIPCQGLTKQVPM